MSQSFNQPISQTFVPSIYRGVSPVIIASDVLDGHDTSGRSASPVRVSPEDSSLRLVSLSGDAPGMHFQYFSRSR